MMANPFHRVCPFHFYDICKKVRVDSGCTYGIKGFDKLHFSDTISMYLQFSDFLEIHIMGFPIIPEIALITRSNVY